MLVHPSTVRYPCSFHSIRARPRLEARDPDPATAGGLAALALIAALSACAGQTSQGGSAGTEMPPDAHVPDFARRPNVPFAREEVVGIAMREWRAFGSLVDDDFPGERPPSPPELKPERWPGYWQRVGEYWWLGIDAGQKETAWTGKHGEFGYEFPSGSDWQYAWSAAFVSYVMRIAGAGQRFPYSPTHSDYIDTAKQMATGETSGYVVIAERLEAYAPQPGDLICMGRGKRAERLRYDDLPAGRFPAHCDIVVQATPGEITVVGGNVDDAVTMKHVPTGPDGRLAAPDGTIFDPRYPWMVVLRVVYAAAVS